MSFLNPLDSNMTNIAKDVFTTSKKDIQKIILGHEKMLMLQKPVGILKKKQNMNTLEKSPNFTKFG